MNDYKPTIGLEIHAELKTSTKMFCSCRNNADEKEANSNVCPVCMAHPGTLPVINKEAVHKVLLVGTALGSTLADFTEFDRKNYFYPDIPKGYQISQYAYPLVKGGILKGVEITRIHLEEDTARSQHTTESGGSTNVSLVDYNRAGVPLMELVTEPVIHDADTATSFARELQILLRYLGAGDANMEKGEMRVEANISVSKTDTFGTKVEVKNLNSFRTVERAIKYEIERQIAVLESGGEIVQETRGWDEAKQATYAQRKKESSKDYRYFPEPDLPKLVISEIPEFFSFKLRQDLPTLPWDRRNNYIKYGISDDAAEMYVRDESFFESGQLSGRGVGTFFDECYEYCEDDKELLILVSNYLTSDIPSVAKKLIEDSRISKMVTFPNAQEFVVLVKMFKNNEIGSKATKEVLEVLMREGGNALEIVLARGLKQKSDESFLQEIAKKVIEANPSVAREYRAGKEAALQFLVGQGMKESRGSANPAVLREQFKKDLSV